MCKLTGWRITNLKAVHVGVDFQPPLRESCQNNYFRLEPVTRPWISCPQQSVSNGRKATSFFRVSRESFGHSSLVSEGSRASGIEKTNILWDFGVSWPFVFQAEKLSTIFRLTFTCVYMNLCILSYVTNIVPFPTASNDRPLAHATLLSIGYFLAMCQPFQN